MWTIANISKSIFSKTAKKHILLLWNFNTQVMSFHLKNYEPKLKYTAGGLSL